jgi:hypothetical protein
VLDETSFPIDANAGEMISPLPEPSFESAGRTYYMTLGISNHDVYRYLSEGQASRDYKRIKRIYFASRKGEPLEIPDGFPSLINNAEQQYLACGIQSDIYMCMFVAQYEEYNIFFHSHIHPDGEMTVEDFFRGIETIDKIMTDCIEGIP